jgi:hypothetical protein
MSSLLRSLARTGLIFVRTCILTLRISTRQQRQVRGQGRGISHDKRLVLIRASVQYLNV